MTGNTDKLKRKRLFVDSDVQGSLVRQLIIHWCLACGLIFLYLFSLQSFSSGFALSFPATLGAMWNQYGMLALVLVVVTPVFVYDSVKLSHRFVGPMISFRRTLRNLAAGQRAEELNFRKGDFWKELTVDFNKVAAELQELRELHDEANPCSDETSADALESHV